MMIKEQHKLRSLTNPMLFVYILNSTCSFIKYITRIQENDK